VKFEKRIPGLRIIGSLLPWMWLGLRLTVRGGRTAAIRTACLTGATAIGSFLIIAALSVPAVVDAQEIKELNRRPIEAASVEEAIKIRAVEAFDAIGDRPLLRVSVANAEDDPVHLPAGVDRLPGPGEMVVSPALRDIIGIDPLAQQRFPQRVVGTVKETGLVAPDELVAYTGVKSSEFTEERGLITGFGGRTGGEVLTPSTGRGTLEQFLSPGRAIAIAFALFLVAPLGVLVATCSRLSATVRDKRLAAIRLLGGSRYQVQLVNSVETGITAAAGCALGYLVFRLVVPHTHSWSFGRFHWYPGDARIGAGLVVGAGVVITLFAMLVATVGSLSAVGRPMSGRKGSRSTSRGPWFYLVAAGTVILLASPLIVPETWPRLRLALLATGLVGSLALMPALPTILLRSASSPALKWASAPVWLNLAARRLRFSAGITSQLVAALTSAVYIAGVGALAASSIGTFRSDEVADGRSTFPHQVSGVSRDVATRIAAVEGVREVSFYDRFSATPVSQPESFVTIIEADCANLTAMFDSISQCKNGTAYRVAGGRSFTKKLEPGARLQRSVGGTTDLAKSVSVVPQATIEVTGGENTADVIFAHSPRIGSADIQVRADKESMEAFFASIAGAYPALYVQGFFRTIPDGLDAGAVLTVVSLGLVLTTSMMVLAFVLATIDRSIAARRQNAALVVIGVPRSVLRAAEAYQMIGNLILGMLFAVACLLLVAGSLSRVVAAPMRQLLGEVGPALSVAGGSAVLVVFVAVMATTRIGRLDASLLRRE
jgi:hypothetical protein